MKLVLTSLGLAALIVAGMVIPAARTAISSLPWGLLILACLTLGLAPFSPPHIVEKLQMLAQGTLSRPIDWFDMLLHGAPWILTLMKGVATALDKFGG
mgnify:CR=1 FL=1